MFEGGREGGVDKPEECGSGAPVLTQGRGKGRQTTTNAQLTRHAVELGGCCQQARGLW